VTVALPALERAIGEEAEVELHRLPKPVTGAYVGQGRLAIFASGAGLVIRPTPAEARRLAALLVEDAALREAEGRGGTVVPRTGTA
jgi:hypothetical protein